MLALSARLVLFFQKVTIDNDGIAYGLAGKNLIESGRYEAFGYPQLIYPPVYPMAIGITDLFFNDLLFSGRLVSLIFGMLLVYMLYILGKKLYSKEAGLFASFFAATNYSLIIYSQETQSESMYLFFILLVFYFYMIIAKRYEHRLAIVLGSLISISYLIRPEGVLFLILPFLLLVQRKKAADSRKILLGFFLTVFSFFAVSAPYVYFLYRHTGKISLTEKASSNIIHGVIFDGTNKERLSDEEALYYEKSIAYYDEDTNTIKEAPQFREIDLARSILEDPGKFFSKYIKGIRSEIIVLLADHSANLILLPLFLTLVYFIKSEKDRKNIGIMSLIAFLYIVILPVFHIESRYLLQVLVFLILLSSFGYAMRKDFKLNIMKLELPGKVFLSFMRTMILFFVLMQFIFSMAFFYLFVRSEDYPWEYKFVGEFIKKDHVAGENAVIMSRNKDMVSYYAGIEKSGVAIPYTGADNIIKFAKANKVDYIVIDARFLRIRENFDDLWNLDRFSENIKLIFEDSSIDPIKVFKYSE